MKNGLLVCLVCVQRKIIVSFTFPSSGKRKKSSVLSYMNERPKNGRVNKNLEKREKNATSLDFLDVFYIFFNDQKSRVIGGAKMQ